MRKECAGRLARAVDLVDGWDHTELGEPRQVVGMDDLGVLDAPAPLRATVRAPRIFVKIEELPDRTVADALDGHLVVVLHGELGGAFDVGDRRHVEAHAAWQIGVGLQEPTAVGAQGSVQHLLADGADREEPVAVSHHAVLVEAALEILRRLLDGHEEPHGQVALICHRLQEVDDLERRAHVLETRDAVGQGRGSRQAHVLPHLVLDSLRRTPGLVVGKRLSDRGGRVLPQHARELAGERTNHLTTHRIRCVARETRLLESTGVHEDPMPARVAEEHGVVGADPAQALVRGQSLHAGRGWLVPPVLMPSPSLDPRARPGFLGRCLHPVDDLVPSACVREVELREHHPEAHVVAMALDQSGYRELALQIDDPRTLADQRLDVCVTPHGDDAISARGQRSRLGKVGIHRHDPPVHQNEIGGLGGSVVCGGAPRRDHRSKKQDCRTP